MALKAWRFISLLFTILAFGPAYAHLLEMPEKRKLSGPDFLTANQHLYRWFALPGGLAEPLAILSTLVVLFLVRKRKAAFLLTLVAAICLVAMFMVFLFGNNPINAKVANWTPATLPANWETFRDRWEYFHATRAALAAIALVTLLTAALRDTRSGRIDIDTQTDMGNRNESHQYAAMHGSAER
jgi:hypothetical protein